jgi:hypothetical protein
MVAVPLGVLLLVSPALAQQGTGELRGRIVDEQGAVLPGVAVVAKNTATGQFRESVSATDGSFFMSALTPGLYEVSAELAGFKKYQRGGVRVEVGDARLTSRCRSAASRAGHGDGRVAARRHDSKQIGAPIRRS